MSIFIVFLRHIIIWYVEVYLIKWEHLYTGAFLDMNSIDIVTNFFPQYFHIIDSIRARKGKVLFVLPDFLLFRFTQPTPKNIWQCSAYCTHEYHHHAHIHTQVNKLEAKSKPIHVKGSFPYHAVSLSVETDSCVEVAFTKCYMHTCRDILRRRAWLKL